MEKPVLYLGDTHLGDAAAYLAGLMHHWGWSFDYVPGDRPAARALFESPRRLFILSDYPAAMLEQEQQQRLVEQVARGAGLVMCGGWESFHGLGGEWNGTLVAEALPVEIGKADDRINCDHPVLVSRACDHPAVAGLPWEQRPPVIGGFNRVTPKRGTTVVLEAAHFTVRRDGGTFRFEPAGRDPLLIVGSHAAGRAAALTTDVAPHWVGPLIDWGDERVSAQAPQASPIEVGDLYSAFLRTLLTWLQA